MMRYFIVGGKIADITNDADVSVTKNKKSFSITICGGNNFDEKT